MNYRIFAGSTALAGCLALPALAGGLDAARQDYHILFERGNVVQAGALHVAPDIEGNVGFPGAGPTGDVGPSFWTGSLGVKMDVSPQLSFSLLVDRPYYSAVAFHEFPAGPVNATYKVGELSALARYKFDDRWSVFGGARALRFSAKGNTMGASYEVKPDTGWGYVLGAAYEISEFGALARLTYKSKVSLSPEASGIFITPTGPLPAMGKIDVDMPQSISLDGRMPVSPKTFVFGSATWTDWSKTKVRPAQNSGSSFSGTNYDDTWAYELGAGHFLTDKLILTGSLMYDTGTDQPPGLETIYSDYKTATLGLTWLDEKFRVSGAIGYTDFGSTSGFSPPLGGAPVRYDGGNAFSTKIEVTYNF